MLPRGQAQERRRCWAWGRRWAWGCGGRPGRRPCDVAGLLRGCAAAASNALDPPLPPPPLQAEKEGPKALEEFCRDLCADVRAGRIDPVIGRETEVRAGARLHLRPGRRRSDVAGAAAAAAWRLWAAARTTRPLHPHPHPHPPACRSTE